MSAAGHGAQSPDAPAASDVAARIQEAPFVRIFARASGDALAAAGVLARALDEVDRPFQAGVAATVAERDRRIAAGDRESLSIAVGTRASADTVPDAGAAVTLPAADRPASVTAHEIAAALGATPEPVLALAGVVAAGCQPGAGDSAPILEAARERGVETRPGVGTPTADLADGLAHSTLVHAPFSGEPHRAQERLAALSLPAELDGDARRRVASLVALEATDVEDDADPERATRAVERALAPHTIPDGEPFATIEGYADVLDAVAVEAPGAGVALALGHDARPAALEAWREHASAAHAALRGATTGRYDGLFVARTDDAPVETVARLLRDYRSPEPVAMAVSDDEAGVAAREDGDVGAVLADAVETVGGASAGGPRRGYARFDGDTKEFIAAFRGAI